MGPKAIELTNGLKPMRSKPHVHERHMSDHPYLMRGILILLVGKGLIFKLTINPRHHIIENIREKRFLFSAVSFHRFL